MKTAFPFLLAVFFLLTSCGKVYHVSPSGDDQSKGSETEPFKTISRAAELAMPGDEILVHEGIYRERVTPPRGGKSDRKRITYRAAEGEKVEIRGSEIIEGWEELGKGVWKVSLPNSFFGEHNPFDINIAGDWLVDGHWCHTGDVYLNGTSLYEARSLDEVIQPKAHERALDQEAALYTWFARVGREQTTIWANFHEFSPEDEQIEINVREACFYPDSAGRNYITVDGFHMSHAATQWAPPSAEQVGMIGTHWSRGWIIRNCILHDSKCSAITLGKDRQSGHNGWEKGTSGAVHYNRVIEKALEGSDWHMDSIGSHLVENNHIYNCEQTGICGSLGPVGSTIRGNHIHHIWTKRLFFGYEIAAIKFHAPIDVLIEGNCLHHADKGLWMDWMTQGTRITGNLCYDNGFADLFSEVNHGPYMVDNNIFLSGIQNWSESGAFVHNLIAGPVNLQAVHDRSTPFMEPHSTEIMGLSNTTLGDDRWYNNIFAGPVDSTADDRWYGLETYALQTHEFPVKAGGNVYLGSARSLDNEEDALLFPDLDAGINLKEADNGLYLHLNLPDTLAHFNIFQVHSSLLGTAVRTAAPWQLPDGSEWQLDTDYFGQPRDLSGIKSGPFTNPGTGATQLKVWQSSGL